METVSMMPRSVKIAYCRKMGLPLPKPTPTEKIEMEIRELQRTTNLLIPDTTFSRLVRIITNSLTPVTMRVEKDAMSALHQTSEAYLVSLFQEANAIAQHCKRSTVLQRDFLLAMRMMCK